MKIIKTVLSLVISLIITGSSYGIVFAGAPGTQNPENLYVKKCSICHVIERSRSKKKSAKGWRTTVMRMKGKKAPITDKEAEIIIRHLTEKYGK